MIGKIFRYIKFQITSIPIRVPSLYIKKYVGFALHPLRYFNRRKQFKSLNLEEVNDLHVKQLKENGFCKIPQLNHNLLAELDKSIMEKLSSLDDQESQNTSKSFWKQVLNSDDLKSDSIFVEYALQKEVLNIVSKYLQAVPYLSRLDLFISKGKKGPYTKSQLWHKDYNDSKTVKLWTYFNDVKNDDAGPFTFLPKKLSKSARLPRFPTHKTDSDFEERFGKFESSKVYGTKHSSFLVDTYSCWHQGSRVAEGKIRIGLVATYQYSSSFYKYDNNIEIGEDLDSFKI